MTGFWDAMVQRAKDAEAAVTPVGKDFARGSLVVETLEEVPPAETDLPPEDNPLRPVYYLVYDTDGTTVRQMGVVQKGEFDAYKANGYDVHLTDALGNIIE